MARASIVGQPLHTSSPLVASFLLWWGWPSNWATTIAKAIWRACVVGIVMLAVGALSAYRSSAHKTPFIPR